MNHSSSERLSPIKTSSPNNKQRIGTGYPRNEKRSPVLNLNKRFPIRKFNKELSTLPEPNDGISPNETQNESTDSTRSGTN